MPSIVRFTQLGPHGGGSISFEEDWLDVALMFSAMALADGPLPFGDIAGVTTFLVGSLVIGGIILLDNLPPPRLIGVHSIGNAKWYDTAISPAVARSFSS